jgi:hypothetical protein
VSVLIFTRFFVNVSPQGIGERQLTGATARSVSDAGCSQRMPACERVSVAEKA